MRTVLTLFPGWQKTARSNLTNLRPHPDSANHTKLLRGDGTFVAGVGGGTPDDGTVTNAKIAADAAIALSKLATDPLARGNHTGTQSADTISDGTTNKAFTATEKTKLSGIASGATANDSDANLKARGNHTGTQLASTISDFAAAVVAAAPAGTSTRETITQAGHGFSAKQAVYNNAGTWALAKADAIGTARVGAVIESVTTDTFVAVTGGKFSGTGLSTGQNYLSDATAGLLTTTAPTTATSYVVPVLLAATSTLASVEIGEPLSLALIPNTALATNPLSTDNHVDGTTNKVFSATEKTKLAGIASGAQVNAAITSQADAEAGLNNTDTMTALRTAQAIAALASGTSEPVGMAKLWPDSMSGSIPSGYSVTGVFGIPAMTSPDADYIGIVKVGAQVATPTFGVAAGTYGANQSVTLSCATSGAAIRYTTDGSTPNRTTGTIYSGAITVSASQTIKAIAYKDFYPDSAVASAAYVIFKVASVTVAANGVDVTIVTTAAASVGAGGSGGIVLNMSGGDVALTYASGAGTTSLVFTAARTILDAETDTGADYTQPGNGIESTTGGVDLASFTGAAVTNDSTQTAGGGTWYDHETSANTDTIASSALDAFEWAPVVVTTGGSATKARIYLADNAAGGNIKMALHASGGGAPLASGVASVASASSNDNAYLEITFGTPYAVSSATTYLIAWCADGGDLSLKYKAGTGDWSAAVDFGYANFPGNVPSPLFPHLTRGYAVGVFVE